jgi:uncharacterized protein (TIGR02588 family)
MTERQRQRRIEMTAFWIGLVVVVAMLVGLIWLEQPGEPEAPRVSARITHVERRAGELTVSFELSNLGTVPVERVIVRIATPRSREPVDHVIEYLPEGTHRRGIAILSGIPENERPSARILGYMIP